MENKALVVLADDLAAMVAVRAEPELECLGQRLSERGPAESTLFDGRRLRANRYSAATLNAAAANWAELDEGYRLAPCHGGLYTIPAVTATAEAEGSNLADVLAAVVVGYEISARFASAWSYEPGRLHAHALFAGVGSAAGVGSLRRLPAVEFARAVTAASAMTFAGTYEHATQGALVRNMWAAAGAVIGMQSVEWAECGIGGASSSPHGAYGVALGGQEHLEKLTDGLGERWAIGDNYHKIYACCQKTHSAAEASIQVREEILRRHGTVDTAAIDEVLVETHPAGLSMSNRDPTSTLAAKFSIPHVVAAALTFGHVDVSAFGAAALEMAEVQHLRAKIQLAPYVPLKEWPNDRPARVTVRLTDGSAVTGECVSAEGGPDRPFPDDRVLEKVDALVGSIHPRFLDTIQGAITDESRSSMKRPWRAFVDQLTAE